MKWPQMMARLDVPRVHHRAAPAMQVTINAGIMPTSISEKTLPASAGPLTASFPTYPHASDYAAGMCAGYAFCFPSWNPPVVTEPDVMCPVGYDLTTSGSAPL